MNKTFVLIDAGFLSKLNKYFGKGNYLRYDIIKFAKNIAKKQNMICEKIFYYTAPPFQSENPTKEEDERKKRYDHFIEKLSKLKEIEIREGRCQRLKIDGKFIYRQKATDSLAIIDLMLIPLKYPYIKKIILIASDSDFVPVVNQLKELNIQMLLYTYYINRRNTNFSRSNHLLNSVSRYYKITKKDFDNCPLEEK